MVSPSKIQQQPQTQPKCPRPRNGGQQQQQQLIRTTTSAPATTTTTTTSTNAVVAGNVRIQKGPKPLERKSFYLDIKNHALSSKLEAKIKELGGTTELFLVKNVSLVVSDRPDRPGAGQGAGGGDRRKWGYTSCGSGGPPSLKSIEVPTPTPTPPTPYRSVEGPLSNSTNQRGSATQRSKSRADAMIERALIQPQQCSVDPLNNALNWGIPIWTVYELQSWLEKIAASLKDPNSSKYCNNNTSAGKQVKIKHLKEPFIKFESYRRETRPVFLELKSWPTLNFDGDPGTCPFDLKRKDTKEVTCTKEIKENREKCFNPDLSKGKDMTRRPRATATRARKTENTGYCEICRIDYRNLSKHLQTDQHLNFVQNDKNFLSLDNLISTGASVEAFLKINRSKDVSKDCNLFTSRDNSFENGLLLPDEKSEKKDKSSLNEFSVGDLRTMQCNGARKNLDSKLDSPHNLRTRAKHESGHLLRSKGRPFDEVEKSEKSFEKYVIKKRAKGTIWIEEEDESENEKDTITERVSFDGKPLCEKSCEAEHKKNIGNCENPPENVSVNGDVSADTADCKYVDSSLNKVSTTPTTATVKDNAFKDSFLGINTKTKVNGYDKKEENVKATEETDCPEKEVKELSHIEDNGDSVSSRINNVNNGEKLPIVDNDDTNSIKSLNKDDRGKYKPARRGGRTYRGRQRLSVEEKLLEDNRDYYKVEVLGNKLRSSAIPPSVNVIVSPSKEQSEKVKKDDKPSSDKPVVVRFKRVRKSELSLLSDEAESFMFGDPKREDDSSENSDGEQSSVLPNETESDREQTLDSIVISSSPHANITPKQEIIEDESQDSSTNCGRARKRRRTQTEALIRDNTDYYKFETPGSRLRYQAPLTGICDQSPEKGTTQDQDSSVALTEEKIYPSKPSAEVEKMHYSFEAVPRSEPWYQTYNRQDMGDEFYYSESDSAKPFLLPYEIENFHEILQKSLIQSGVYRKRGRSRGGHVNMGMRSPRKSPRCHASTLAIMSTIVKRREQQQTTTLNTIEEEGSSNNKVKPSQEAAKPAEKKTSEKSDVDADLKQIVQNIDNMLSEGIEEMDTFEVDLLKTPDEATLQPTALPKGAPENLLEILDRCNDPTQPNGLENSSCASSECGELMADSPLRRRKKKRKNKTGWPGNKMRRKLHIKNLNEELQKELQKEREMVLQHEFKKELEENTDDLDESHQTLLGEEMDDSLSLESQNVLPEDESEHETGKENEQLLNVMDSKESKSRRIKNKESRECKESEEYKNSREISESRDAAEVDEKNVLKPVFGDEVTPRKRRRESSDKCSADEDEVESQLVKGTNASSLSEDSEASLSNNENLCAKDANALAPHEKRSPVRFKRKRQRKSTTSSETSNHVEAENRKQSSVGSSPKKQQPQQQIKEEPSEVQELALESVSGGKRSKKEAKRLRRNDRTPTQKALFEDENCKKESFLSISRKKRQKRPRRNDSLSSELPNGEIDPLERGSPALSSDAEHHRRSSIDFQPVVRVMKIDDQVDMDNSILTVAVASNRRLRSSGSSPKAKKSVQPPKKRFRNGSGKRHISGQWMKSS